VITGWYPIIQIGYWNLKKLSFLAFFFLASFKRLDGAPHTHRDQLEQSANWESETVPLTLTKNNSSKKNLRRNEELKKIIKESEECSEWVRRIRGKGKESEECSDGNVKCKVQTEKERASKPKSGIYKC
jgi:hypothetical protein